MKCPVCSKEMTNAKMSVTGWKLKDYNAKIWYKAYRWVCKDHPMIIVMDHESTQDYTDTVERTIREILQGYMHNNIKEALRIISLNSFVNVEHIK